MIKLKLWQIALCIVLSIVVSPFLGEVVSSFYSPYAKSDDDLSSAFMLGTIFFASVLSFTSIFCLRKMVKS